MGVASKFIQQDKGFKELFTYFVWLIYLIYIIITCIIIIIVTFSFLMFSVIIRFLIFFFINFKMIYYNIFFVRSVLRNVSASLPSSAQKQNFKPLHPTSICIKLHNTVAVPRCSGL